MKILAHDLDKAMAGLPLFVARQKDDIDYFQNEIEGTLKSALNSFELKDTGVYVQASTLGSLEAFLQLLKNIQNSSKDLFKHLSLKSEILSYSMRELTLDLFIEKMLFEHQLNLKRV